MQTTEQREQHPDIERHKREVLNDRIEKQVIHTLGTPGNLLKVQVRLLWKNHYRVNIFVGPDAVSARVANSYFLGVGNDGNIMTSDPKIKRQYEPSALGVAEPPLSRALSGKL